MKKQLEKLYKLWLRILNEQTLNIEHDAVFEPKGFIGKQTKEYNMIILHGRKISSYDIRIER